MLTDLEMTINDFALKVGGVFIAPNRHAHFRKNMLKSRLDKIIYFWIATDFDLIVVDGRHPTGKRLEPYKFLRVNLADPECFDKISRFIIPR